MSGTRFGLVAFVLGSLVVQGCGGGGSGPNPPPPPPPPTPGALAKQAGDNQNGTVGEALPVAPAVKVTTTAGAPVSGVTVTFAVASGGGTVTGANPVTGSDGVATVGTWVLGGSAGVNTLTATITAGGVTGNPATFTANATLAAFNPSANLSLSGVKNYATINIPAGVTVTMTGDLTLNATGAVTIAGNVVGNCVALAISADGLLTVSGNLNNGCTGAIPQTGLPSMTLVGKGGWSLNGPGGWTAAGDVTVTDDPTATDADFASPPAGGQSLRTRLDPASVGTPCNAGASFTGVANPNNTPDGADGNPNGANAPKDGATWVLRCKNGPDINLGSISLAGQNGGRGGHGTHTHVTAAVSKGGNGANGGKVKIQATGNIVLGGGFIHTGSGGAGGNSTAEGTGAGGDVGASADATAGNGGTPGLFEATAKNGFINITGALTLDIGVGGRGGDAFATGHDGHNAAPCPPAAGGPASAFAGDGGSTPDKQLRSFGAVAGGGNLTVTGGHPGNGGDAKATAGKGGNGAQPCKPGAIGGDPRARGGNGGNGELRNLAGLKVANGGNGGSMEVRDGKGGRGFVDCVQPFEEGGKGGMGGTSRGSNGNGGSGLQTGTFGAALLNVVSNGGNGGDGLPPGAGGEAGGNSVLFVNVGPTITDPSFQPGTPGTTCAGFTMVVTPSTQTVAQGATGSIHIVIVRTGTFTLAVTFVVKDQTGTVRATGTIPAGQTQTDITIPVSGPNGAQNWTVTGSGTGAPDLTKNFEVVATQPAGTVNYVFQNGEQATRPYTLVASRVGSGAYTSHPIAANGTVTVPVPTTLMPFELLFQQQIDNDRRTFVLRTTTTELVTLGPNAAGQKARGNLTALMTNLAPNTQGLAFAGAVTGFFPQPNSAPFTVPMNRVATGIDVANGCTGWAGGNPATAILRVGPLTGGTTLPCDFAAPGLKNYVTNPITVNGVAGGTTLGVTGGFALGDQQTTIYNRNFTAPTTTKYALNGADLPENVLNFASVNRVGSTTVEQTFYYFTNPGAWGATLPPTLNNPTPTLTNIFNGYYNLDVALVTQSNYSAAWLVQYFQPNSFGGNNEVTIYTLASYLGGSIPGTLHVMTPTDLLLDPAYMPKSPGHPTGNVAGFSSNPFMAASPGETRNIGVRTNVVY